MAPNRKQPVQILAYFKKSVSSVFKRSLKPSVENNCPAQITIKQIMESFQTDQWEKWKNIVVRVVHKKILIWFATVLINKLKCKLRHVHDNLGLMKQ